MAPPRPIKPPVLPVERPAVLPLDPRQMNQPYPEPDPPDPDPEPDPDDPDPPEGEDLPIRPLPGDLIR